MDAVVAVDMGLYVCPGLAGRDLENGTPPIAEDLVDVVNACVLDLTMSLVSDLDVVVLRLVKFGLTGGGRVVLGSGPNGSARSAPLGDK